MKNTKKFKSNFGSKFFDLSARRKKNQERIPCCPNCGEEVWEVEQDSFGRTFLICSFCDKS